MTTFNTNLLPASSGLSLGTSSQQWNANLANLAAGASIVKTLNGLVFADQFTGASVTAQLDAAIGSLGVNFGIVIIPSTMGIGAPSNVPANVTLWDLRGGSNTLTTNSVSWNAKSGSGLHAMIRAIQTINSPASSDLAIYGQNMVTGTLPSNQSLDGISGEVDTIGPITVGPGLNLVGVEGSVNLGSTGGAIPSIYGGLFNISSGASNTTNATLAAAIRAQAYSKAGSETVTTCVGLYADKQTAGTSNLSIYALGDIQVDGKAFFDNSSAGVRNVVIQGDATASANVLEIVNTHASGHTWDIGEVNAVGRLSIRDLSATGGPMWSLAVAGTGANEGIFTHSNTATRTYSLPDYSMTPVGVVASISQKAESAADANVLTFTPPAVAGSYRLRFVLSLSAANAAVLGWTATWKDSNGNAQAPTNLSLLQTGTAAPALTFTTSVAGNYHAEAQVDIDNSATAIVIKITFSGTSFAGKASATIERLI